MCSNAARKLTVLDDRERQMHTLSKPAFSSPLKIDGAMAAVLAWEALGDAISAYQGRGIAGSQRDHGPRELCQPGFPGGLGHAYGY
jgi:predicted hotdog family 3-hydroxylacyl-ACP dehydratase